MALRSLRRSVYATVALASTLLLSGCANFYVDTGLKDVPPQDIAKPASPQDVQLIFEFRTKGVANAGATALLKDQVTQLVSESGVFARVSGTPEQSAGFLSVVIDNVPLSDDAFSKGFVTGLTFGLAGNTVTDGYVGTIEYTPAGQKKSIKTTVRHAIHTTVGAQGAPANATPSASLDEAAKTMTRHVVMNGLKTLSHDKSFISGN